MMFPILEAGPALDEATLPAFVVARDGLYLRKRSLLGLSQTKVGRIAHLPEGKEFVDYALPKVPADLMARAVGFFRAVYRLQRTEALSSWSGATESSTSSSRPRRCQASRSHSTLRPAMCRPDRGSSARCTAMAPLAPTPVRSTRTTRRSSMGSTSSSATSTGDGSATQPQSSSTASGFS